MPKESLSNAVVNKSSDLAMRFHGLSYMTQVAARRHATAKLRGATTAK